MSAEAATIRILGHDGLSKDTIDLVPQFCPRVVNKKIEVDVLGRALPPGKSRKPFLRRGSAGASALTGASSNDSALVSKLIEVMFADCVRSAEVCGLSKVTLTMYSRGCSVEESLPVRMLIQEGVEEMLVRLSRGAEKQCLRVCVMFRRLPKRQYNHRIGHIFSWTWRF